MVSKTVPMQEKYATGKFTTCLENNWIGISKQRCSPQAAGIWTREDQSLQWLRRKFSFLKIFGHILTDCFRGHQSKWQSINIHQYLAMDTGGYRSVRITPLCHFSSLQFESSNLQSSIPLLKVGSFPTVPDWIVYPEVVYFWTWPNSAEGPPGFKDTSYAKLCANMTNVFTYFGHIWISTSFWDGVVEHLWENQPMIHWEKTSVLDNGRGQELLVKKALNIIISGTISEECVNKDGEMEAGLWWCQSREGTATPIFDNHWCILVLHGCK